VTLNRHGLLTGSGRVELLVVAVVGGQVEDDPQQRGVGCGRWVVCTLVHRPSSLLLSAVTPTHGHPGANDLPPM